VQLVSIHRNGNSHLSPNCAGPLGPESPNSRLFPVDGSGHFFSTLLILVRQDGQMQGPLE